MIESFDPPASSKIKYSKVRFNPASTFLTLRVSCGLCLCPPALSCLCAATRLYLIVERVPLIASRHCLCLVQVSIKATISREENSRCWICVSVLDRDLTHNKAAKYQEGVDCILASMGLSNSQ